MARCIRFDDIAINAMCEAVERFHATEVSFRKIHAYYNLVMKKMRTECRTQVNSVGFSREGRYAFFAEYDQYFSPLKGEVGYIGIKLRTGVGDADLQSLKKRIAVELFDFFSDVETLVALEK